MKQIFTTIRLLTMAIAVTVVALSASAQPVAELVFKNPTRTGTNGAINTVYRFANVTTGVDALVKITAKSSTLVTLSNIDLTSSGFGNAFQPQIEYNNGSAPSNTTWWMEFQISFVQNSNNANAVTVSSFNLTALDMDGDDNRLREQMTMYGLNSYTLETPTAITVSNPSSGGGKIFTGSSTDYSNINTSATNIMVTATYTNTSSFTIRVGGATGNASSNKTERMSSLWFKSFTYNSPANAILPVDLEHFTARKSDNGTLLDWTSSREQDFGYFVVQGSTDGKHFTDLAKVYSDGNNSSVIKRYSWIDNSKQNGTIHYRLKMIDKDQQFSYSPVKTIRNTETSDASIGTFPNPATSDLKISIPADWQNKQVVYSIYAASGTMVKTKTSIRASQTESLGISELKTGTYFIRVTAGSASTVKQFCKAG